MEVEYLKFESLNYGGTQEHAGVVINQTLQLPLHCTFHGSNRPKLRPNGNVRILNKFFRGALEIH
jgi:hypothetical protein